MTLSFVRSVSFSSEKKMRVTSSSSPFDAFARLSLFGTVGMDVPDVLEHQFRCYHAHRRCEQRPLGCYPEHSQMHIAASATIDATTVATISVKVASLSGPYGL